MTKVITAPELFYPTPNANRVYLAGAIDMGRAVNWQYDVIQALDGIPNLILFNPRRELFTPGAETEQIIWELNAMSRAHWIFMWFPKDALAPISLFEAGLYMDSGKLLIGVEPGYYRQQNLLLTCKRHDVPMYRLLEDMIGDLRQLVTP